MLADGIIVPCSFLTSESHLYNDFIGCEHKLMNKLSTERFVNDKKTTRKNCMERAVEF